MVASEIYTLIDYIILHNDLGYATVPWDSFSFLPEVCIDTSYYALVSVLHISPSRLHSVADIWILVLIANTLKRQSLTSFVPAKSAQYAPHTKTSVEGKNLVHILIPIGNTGGECDPGLSLVASVLRLSVVLCPLSVVPWGTHWHLLLFTLCTAGIPPLIPKPGLFHSVLL